MSEKPHDGPGPSCLQYLLVSSWTVILCHPVSHQQPAASNMMIQKAWADIRPAN